MSNYQKWPYTLQLAGELKSDIVAIGQITDAIYRSVANVVVHHQVADRVTFVLTGSGGCNFSARKLLTLALDNYEHVTVAVHGHLSGAGTLIAAGAHQVVFGPAATLGPLSPMPEGSKGGWSGLHSVIEASAQMNVFPEDTAHIAGTFTSAMAAQADVNVLSRDVEYLRRTKLHLQDAMKDAGHSPTNEPGNLIALADVGNAVLPDEIIAGVFKPGNVPQSLADFADQVFGSIEEPRTEAYGSVYFFSAPITQATDGDAPSQATDGDAPPSSANR